MDNVEINYEKQKEIDFLLDDIRKACELGEIESVISLSEKLKNTDPKPTPLNWLKKKFIIEGSSYIEPTFTLRHTASLITEYNNYEKV